MNVVDSSAWLEYFADGPNAGFFAKSIEQIDTLMVPTLCLFEVFKRVAHQRNENDALRAVAVMHQGTVVDLDATLAVNAARISIEHQIPMADGVLLATARVHDATLWTQDDDFKNLPKARYRKRKS